MGNNASLAEKGSSARPKTATLASFLREILPEILNAGAFQLSMQKVAWSIREKFNMEGVYLFKLEEDVSLVLQAQAGPPPSDRLFSEVKTILKSGNAPKAGLARWKVGDGSSRTMFHATLNVTDDCKLILGVLNSRLLKADLEKLQYVCAIITPALSSAYKRQQLSNDLIDARRLVHDTKAEQRAKSAFLSRMSHDLRTPLSVLLGFAQLLEMENLNRRQNEHVQHILQSGRQLLYLINQVLELSEIDSGKLTLQLEPVHLTTLVTKCVDMLLPKAREKGITVTIDEQSGSNLWVLADADRLEQIVSNLLSNAIKFNVRDGRVSVASVTGSDNRVQLRVTDTGPGVAQSQMPRLFEPFDRLDVGGDIEGAGLGLAISRVLSEALGGRLRVESTLGRGSTFTLEIPAAKGPMSDTK